MNIAEGILIKNNISKELKPGFSKRSFVIETGSKKKPCPVIFDIWDREVWDRLMKHREGGRIRVAFDVRGRHYRDESYYVSLTALDIVAAGDLFPEEGGADLFPEETEESIRSEEYNSNDDLPF